MRHKKGGKYVKDVVYGANDGIITTFAVVAGVMGSGLSEITIILLGIANLLADGFSMAMSNYLGSKSEAEFYEKERIIEEWEVEHDREKEVKETEEFLMAKGYSFEDSHKFVELFSKNKELWVDFMMKEELNLAYDEQKSYKTSSTLTFFSFVCAGLVPLLPFLVWNGDRGALFTLAIFFTGLALFFVGAMRTHFTGKNWAQAGFEMLLVGGMASVIAYSVGAIVKSLIGY